MTKLLGHNTLEDIEEELKNKVIMKYVRDLGFAIEEISFEKQLKLKLGRGTHRVDSDEQIKQASGRLDILCQKAGKNIFLIEVKRPGVELTSDEIDQAISYSRLLDQMDFPRFARQI